MKQPARVQAKAIAIFTLSVFSSVIAADSIKQVIPHNTTIQQSSVPVASTSSDVDKITAKLKSTFDKPDSPLTVFPVVVEGQHAVAGWSQGGKGGRAFLEKTEQGWLVRMCSGESLTQINTLTSLGTNPISAKKITDQLKQEEATMNPQDAALLSSFEGTVMLEGGKHGPEHSAHQTQHHKNTHSAHSSH